MEERLTVLFHSQIFSPKGELTCEIFSRKASGSVQRTQNDAVCPHFYELYHQKGYKPRIDVFIVNVAHFLCLLELY